MAQEQLNGGLIAKILTGVAIILIAGAITTLIVIYAKQEVLISKLNELEQENKELKSWMERYQYGPPRIKL